MVFVISLELQNKSISTALYRFMNRETEAPVRLYDLPRAHSKQGLGYLQSHQATICCLKGIDSQCLAPPSSLSHAHSLTRHPYLTKMGRICQLLQQKAHLSLPRKAPQRNWLRAEALEIIFGSLVSRKRGGHGNCVSNNTMSHATSTVSLSQCW